MIYLISKDDFTREIMKNFIIQISPHLLALNQELSFVTIEIEYDNDKLHLFFEEKKSFIKTPLKGNDFFEAFYQLVFDTVVTINKFQFYPFKQVISYQNKEIKLNFISNEIIRNIYLHKKTGIDKEKLYSTIWPNDKEFLINKLDTHLTNTKNLIEDKFQIEFKYSSKRGVVGLLD